MSDSIEIIAPRVESIQASSYNIPTWDNLLNKPSVFPPDFSSLIFGQKITRDWDGSFSDFTTCKPFISGKIGIYCNGLRLESGHFQITSNSGINLSFCPYSGDNIYVDYVKA
jgi:hypothetical protein